MESRVLAWYPVVAQSLVFRFSSVLVTLSARLPSALIDCKRPSIRHTAQFEGPYQEMNDLLHTLSVILLGLIISVHRH